MKYSIAIIGSEDAILGFKALGADPHPVTSKEDLLQTITRLIELSSYAILFVTEDFFGIAKEEIFELSKRPLPAIIPIPSHKGSEGLGREKIKRIVEQAVGSDILGN